MTELYATILSFVTIPVLVFILIGLYISRKRTPRLSGRVFLRQYESRMGQYLRNYKPRTTIHSLVNKLYVTPEGIRSFRAILQQEQFADVSFWQGWIDWLKMRTKARKVIIRAGQNLWTDIKFVWNWIEARKAGFVRGLYWFFDGRISPAMQAAVLVGLIKDDKPELEIWIDWEKNFGGPHEGLKNVVAMMQEVERLLPGVTVGIYTGYYWILENSNPVWNAAQYKYLSARPLWLAFYAEAADVLIPAPWGRMKYWQFGTPELGHEWGVESKEIDMNLDMDSDPDPTPLPDPEPIGETMHGTVTTFTNIRASYSKNSADLGDLLTGDRLEYHDELWAGLDGLKYRRLINATRNGVPVYRNDGKAWGEVDAYAYAVNIKDDPTPPAPVPADVVRVSLAQTIRAEINGVSYVARVDAANLEMTRE